VEEGLQVNCGRKFICVFEWELWNSGTMTTVLIGIELNEIHVRKKAYIFTHVKSAYKCFQLSGPSLM